MSAFTWHLIFWIIRYGLVAVLLAYLTYVFVKKKDIQTKKGAMCWNGGWRPIRKFIDG